MIEISRYEGITTLRMNHGKANAMDIEFLEAIEQSLDAARDAKAVVLTGTGSIFSAGVDLVRLINEGPDYVRVFLPLLNRCLKNVFTFPRPLVAAVNGHAIAGGCLLALASDMKVMTTGKGSMGVSELLVGVPFPSAALEIVRFAVSNSHQQAMVFSGKSFSVQDALSFGLVNELQAPETLLSRAQEIAAQLAAIPAEAFRLTKTHLRALALDRINQATSYDLEVFNVWMSSTTQEAIREFLQKQLGK